MGAGERESKDEQRLAMRLAMRMIYSNICILKIESLFDRVWWSSQWGVAIFIGNRMTIWIEREIQQRTFLVAVFYSFDLIAITQISKRNKSEKKVCQTLSASGDRLEQNRRLVLSLRKDHLPPDPCQTVFATQRIPPQCNATCDQHDHGSDYWPNQCRYSIFIHLLLHKNAQPVKQSAAKFRISLSAWRIWKVFFIVLLA